MMHMSETPSHPMIAFGPVPSRRLGRSVGVNHIPPKTCSYACVYCQVGPTNRLRTARRAFYAEDDIVADIERRVTEAWSAGEAIDYLTFVPDGEPTLDLSLGRVIDRVKSLGIKIAVISNGSLLWRADVRETLAAADWISVKVDAVRPDIWRRLNRPHRSLWLGLVLEGILTLARDFQGELATETMLVRGVNDDTAHLIDVAGFLGELQPDVAYLAVPTRPPAEPWVTPPPENVINRAFQLIRDKVARTELLIGYEGNAFASTGNLADDLLSIMAVHPMREDAVQELTKRAGAELSVVQSLLEQGKLVKSEYDGHKFYTRKLKGISEHGQAK